MNNINHSSVEGKTTPLSFIKRWKLYSVEKLWIIRQTANTTKKLLACQWDVPNHSLHSIDQALHEYSYYLFTSLKMHTRFSADEEGREELESQHHKIDTSLHHLLREERRLCRKIALNFFNALSAGGSIVRPRPHWKDQEAPYAVYANEVKEDRIKIKLKKTEYTYILDIVKYLFFQISVLIKI